MKFIENEEVAAGYNEGRAYSDTCPTEVWVVQLKGDGDDCLITDKIIVGNQEAVADWIRAFLNNRIETMKRLTGSFMEIKVRATTHDTVQGIASTIDGLAYVQVRAMLFSVEVL